MTVLFIGKRFYTNRDALREKYGRIWQLPWHWAQSGIPTRLWLVDYHSRETARITHSVLEVVSTPVHNFSVFRQWMMERSKGRNKAQVVVASGDCYIGLMAYRIACRLRARFVFDVYDKYDEFSGYRRLPGFDPFNFLLQHGNACLFASRALMESSAVDPSRKLYTPNGIDLKHFYPRDIRESRTTFRVSEKTAVVGYFGSMTADRGVADLIAAVRLLREGGLSAEVLLAGRQSREVQWDEPWVRYLGNLPYDRTPEAMSCCDVLALPYRHSDYLDMASSCKIAEYISMQRPLAATNTPNFSMNFPAQAAQLGTLLAAPGNPDDLARVISLQLQEKRLVALPDGIEWQSIATHLAREIGLTSESTRACL